MKSDFRFLEWQGAFDLFLLFLMCLTLLASFNGLNGLCVPDVESNSEKLAVEDLVQTFAFFIFVISLALFILRLPLRDFPKELVLVFFLGTPVMLMLFWLPPVDICPEGGKTPCLKEFQKNYSKEGSTMEEFTVNNSHKDGHEISFVEQLIIEEHKKAVTEIKLRIEREDDWFHQKFLLVGMLLFGFAAKLIVDYTKGKSNNQEMVLVVICLFLAVATCIALAIDAHLRSLMSGAAQLGVWIHRHVEDLVLLEQGFLGWETFIRHGHGVKNTGGMHTDVIWRFTWPHLHIITWLLYSIYLLLLFQAWKQTKIDKGRGGVHNGLKLQRQWLKVSFWFVHILLCGFAWIAHGYPNAFVTKPWPWTTVYVQSHWHQPFQYVGLSAILPITVWLYLKILDRTHQ